MATVIDFYNKYSEQYAKFEKRIETEPDQFSLLTQLRKREQELLQSVPKNSTALYLAGGSGVNPVTLVKSGASVVTIELSEKMVEQMCKTFSQYKIPYRLANKLGTDLRHQLISNGVVIVRGDIRKLNIPVGFFGRIYCYCTLPLLGSQWKKALKGFVQASPWGVVSVYDPKYIKILAQYYRAAGFTTTIKDNTIYQKGGFKYQCLDRDEIEKIIEPVRNLVVEQVGIGNLFIWG